MPADFSTDLRARILNAALSEPAPAVAKRFSVSISTVERLLKRHREGLSLERRQTRFGPSPALNDQDRAAFEAFLQENVSMPHAEMADRFEQQTGRRISRQTVQRHLSKWRITRKKSPSGPRSNAETT